jgi:hypothetical protein
MANGNQLSDRHAVPRDDERLSFVERLHDSTAVVAQLSLRNAPAHPIIVARALQHRPRCIHAFLSSACDQITGVTRLNQQYFSAGMICAPSSGGLSRASPQPEDQD